MIRWRVRVVTISVPNSATQGPLGAGSFSFVAQYSGDSNYGSSISPIEPLTINKASPTIVTVATLPTFPAPNTATTEFSVTSLRVSVARIRSATTFAN